MDNIDNGVVVVVVTQTKHQTPNTKLNTMKHAWPIIHIGTEGIKQYYYLKRHIIIITNSFIIVALKKMLKFTVFRALISHDMNVLT